MSACQTGIGAFEPLNNYLNKGREKVNSKVKGTRAVYHLVLVFHSGMILFGELTFLSDNSKTVILSLFGNGGPFLYPILSAMIEKKSYFKCQDKKSRTHPDSVSLGEVNFE